MSARFDTTPTAEDLTAARAMLDSVRASNPASVVREALVVRVAIELGVIVPCLWAATEVEARHATQARALYAVWLEQ